MRQSLATSKLFALLVLLASLSPAQAAVDHLEFFDLQRCTRGSVTTDYTIGPGGTRQHDEDTAALKEADKRANGRWLLESAPRCFGFCKRTPSGIRCDADSCAAFPLAGASFTRVNDKGSLPSYKCVSGCGKGVPAYIHDLGYGGDADERNRMWERLKKRMQKQCGTKFDR